MGHGRWIGLLIVLIIASVGSVSDSTAGSDFTTGRIDCSMSEQEFRDAGAAAISAENLNIYAGYDQVSNINQNPVVAAYNTGSGERVFCRDDYERTGVDGRAAGLHTNGSDVYVYIRVDGGFTDSPLVAAAEDNVRAWTRSVGAANSGNFAVVARLDLTAGDVTNAAFITAILSNGKSNSVGIRDMLCTQEGRVRLRTDSFFSPRRIGGSAMTQTGSGDSPFDYTVDLTPNLRDVTFTFAVGWEAIGTQAAVTACPDSTLQGIATKLDTTQDGRISPTDAMFVINRLGASVTGENIRADVNNDGVITADDARAVLRRLGE